MSLSPVIFDNEEQFSAAVEDIVRALRKSDAIRFRTLADDYGLQALRENGDVCERANLEGIAGGLRIAAALVESQTEVTA